MCLFLFYFVLFRIRLLRVEKLAEKHSGPLQLWSHTVHLPNLSGSRRAKLITIHLSGTDRKTETFAGVSVGSARTFLTGGPKT